MDIAIVAGLGLLLLLTLIAFGVGHARWSVVSVTAAFLVALMIPTYLYFAARLLDHEWRWAQAFRKTQLKLIRVRDAQQPSPDTNKGGRLEAIPETLSNQQLQRELDRWQRALTRIDNWRGRHWTNALFVPPPADGQAGTVTLKAAALAAAADAPADDAAEEPAEGAAPAAAPRGTAIDPGTTVYLFDDAAFTPDGDGGRYLGAFVVQAVAADEGTGSQVLTVQQTAPRDAYDRRLWSQAHDSVSVYTQLPSDRWLAFSQTPAPPPGAEPADDDDQRIAPQPRKRLDEALDELVPEPYRDAVRRHALSATDAPDPIEEADWPAVREALAKGDALPGEYWAEVTFGDRADLEAFLKLAPDDISGDAGLSIEMDFSSADELREKNTVTIDKVFYRRRLIDGQALLHGLALPAAAGGGAELVADGQAALRQILEREKAALERANARLANGLEKARGELGLLEKQAAEFATDLVSWQRDSEAAERLADRFEEEAKAAAARLRQTEQEVVQLGRKLVENVDQAVREIDRVAPPPAARGAAAF
jgi:hypothetical protein